MCHHTFLRRFVTKTWCAMQSVRTTHAPQDCVVRRTDCYCLSWAAIGVAAIIAPLLRHHDRNRTRAESQTGTAHTAGSGDPIRERERVGYCSRGLHIIVAAPSEPTVQVLSPFFKPLLLWHFHPLQSAHTHRSVRKSTTTTAGKGARN